MGKARNSWQKWLAHQEKRRVRRRKRQYIRKQKAEWEAEVRLKSRTIIRRIMDFIRGKYF
ncbi:hypothetical protein H1R81_01340 [Emticicia sp. BO119]|nr:hypothetical protein [Emticicia sp. BO119]